MVPFVNDVLVCGPQEFGCLFTGQAVSGLVSGLLIGHAGKVISPGRLIALSAAAAALLFGVAFNFPSLRRIYVIVTLLGFPSVGFYVSTQTLLQSSVADEYRGRVFGALGTTNALLGLSTLGLGARWPTALGCGRCSMSSSRSGCSRQLSPGSRCAVLDRLNQPWRAGPKHRR